MCSESGMEEPRNRYILLNDRVGELLERSLLTLAMSFFMTPPKLLRGDLLEALPGNEHSSDPTKIALGGIDRKIRVECGMKDIMKLTVQEANLLLAISSLTLRYQICFDRKLLDFGKRLEYGSQVLVSINSVSEKLPGVVWFKGELPSSPGTLFGIELNRNPGSGTSDGTFRNKRYFRCAPNSGVFVGLDKLAPFEDDNSELRTPSKSPKRDDHGQVNLKSRLDSVIPSFFKGKSDLKFPQPRHFDSLKIDQRVVTFCDKGAPLRGTVRFTGDVEDSSGHVQSVVGLELDERHGSGNGKWKGHQLFVCRKDYACFVDIETVMLEEDFGKDAERANKKAASQKQDKQLRDLKMQERRLDREIPTRSLSYPREASDRASKGTVRRANSFNSAAVIVAAGESSKTDTREFIEKQQQLLDGFKKSPFSDEDVTMNDDERTDSASFNLNFDDKHFQISVSHNQPITTQPGFSEAGYYDYVNIDEDGNEEAWNSYNKAGEYVTAMQLDPEIDQYPRQHAPEVSPGRMRESEIRSSLSQEPSVVAGSHGEGQQIEEVQGIEDQKTVEVPRGFELGTMVEVPTHTPGQPTFGVIRWIGYLPQMKDKLIVGLELEQEISACSDGTFNGTRYFTCQSGRGFFCMLENCRKDSRFTPNSPSSDTVPSGKAFGSSESSIIKGITGPPEALREEFCGNMRGLQGHHNSCYLDATLYSMFAFSCVFDTLLLRKRRETDLPEYDDVQSVLREAIVNPLRLEGFVRADRVLHLRKLLDKLSSTAGLINEEKDPEEFLNSLLKQVLKADPFLHLKSRDSSMKDGEGAYFYQIITEKDDSVKIAQVQNILEDSFFSADIILAEVPSCLILQMPRFGSRYKMYDMILPNLELDVSYIVESVPRVCNMCGQKVAQYECKTCLQTGMFNDEDNGITSFCSECHQQIHINPKRRDHKFRPILVPRQLIKQTEEKQFLPGKQKMDLFAVVCIETSHYVAFVKCGTTPDSPWCFFDSMADRKGEKNGYNIPAVTPCPEAVEWLSKDPKEILAAKERGEVPDKVRRLLGDGYLCMYQNLDMTMYK
ncbi:PREDICTED: ubiquitin carboxyl-terminal hydrolase CYLD-like isoform X2 [Acropora digitifera]|uniref:ubiquitin carboxyl-terminal hydrolase CYLD-like isoform X2 n=2 Tax=Acropora digitifera TaxID=70779 RepID=UPI00077B05FD|nr:PREDICTED: ubiquitin carboxyl-terminal hydrolase CYLD-like isoform X2 [Acropora digitifera]